MERPSPEGKINSVEDLMTKHISEVTDEDIAVAKASKGADTVCITGMTFNPAENGNQLILRLDAEGYFRKWETRPDGQPYKMANPNLATGASIGDILKYQHPSSLDQ